MSDADSSSPVPLIRLESILQTMRNKVEEIKGVKLFGIWSKEFPDLYENIVDRIEQDINENVLILPEPQKCRTIENFNPLLEDILGMVDNIVNTICKNSAVHELVSYILRDLCLEKEIRYLICIGSSLATLPLIENLLDILYGDAFFHKLKEFLQSYEQKYFGFNIIFIPSLVLQKKFYWSLIAHELGHILNNRHNLVEDHNRKMELPQHRELTNEEKNYYHGMEYVCDFIANAYFGPVYYEALYEYVYVNKIFMGRSHPVWQARLFFLQKLLPEINAGKNIVTNNPPELFTDIANICEIIESCKTKVYSKPTNYYKKTRVNY
jgi:hypothetical protein